MTTTPRTSLPGSAVRVALARLMAASSRRADARHYLSDYRLTQLLPPERLWPLQIGRLHRLCWHAYSHVPGYRKMWNDAFGAAAPVLLSRLERLDQLPLTDRGIFMALPEHFQARSLDRRAALDPDGLLHRHALALRAAEWRAARGADPESAPGPLSLPVDDPLEDDLAGTIASPCGHGGLHLHGERVLIEVIDEGGRVLPCRSFGQLVLTELCGFRRPIIRLPLPYFGRLHQGCRCSLRLLRLEDVRKLAAPQDGPCLRAAGRACASERVVS